MHTQIMKNEQTKNKFLDLPLVVSRWANVLLLITESLGIYIDFCNF